MDHTNRQDDPEPEPGGTASHDRFAATYDQQTKEFHSFSHDVLFGMCYEYIHPEETLLDLGIGTGLSSYLFAKAGLRVVGVDDSEEMLEQCRKKKFAESLLKLDLNKLPLPYPDGHFSHVICCGVFHFLSDLEPILSEVSRLLKPGGIFGFTVAQISEDSHHARNTAAEDRDSIPDISEFPTEWGVTILSTQTDISRISLRIKDYSLKRNRNFW